MTLPHQSAHPRKPVPLWTHVCASNIHLRTLTGPGISHMPARCTAVTLAARLLVAPLLGLGLVMSARALGLLGGLQPIGIIGAACILMLI